MFLDLGCGSKKFAQHTAETEFTVPRQDVIRSDFYGTDDIDIKQDLEKFPYNFKNNEFDGVLLSHVYEHFKPYEGIKLLEELHRITKPGAKIIIYCPHFSNPAGKAHLTHQRLVGLGTLDNFLPESLEKYSNCSFEITEKKLILGSLWNKIFILNKLIGFLITKYPIFSETYLATFIPIREIKFVLKTVK